ncbi:MAG: hypothetical protein A3H70_03605 [Candidatus Komeilibacteria bacterium RIFCSPLOWO2_02_FULL_48_11]|uniref:ECF transporter S component n=1 Tax=Candidatus Komeilibacteria bacterium RIFCSPLOWO2_02_FULL_48_11 TaxID=1798553 RepID=A0A1G2BRT8_9BACT|nr:MAG: hypothetical protein A3H70_03605 [Candidatus Komeilibacteria bacterium RIFCSPLOWO2_02_FULL_48_11]
MRNYFTKKNLIFLLIFTLLGFIALQVPFTTVIGSKVKFTLFDFFGPMASGFIGTLPGIAAVFLMQAINFLWHGAKVVDAGTIIRFFPPLAAVWYFGSKSKFNIIIPIIAIIAFNIHPIGRSAWLYSMFWLIPIICYFLRDRFLLARSLGATFTAHALGGALWIYAFGLSKEIWLGLIPITAIERSLFALGIAATYLVFNNVLNVLAVKKIANVEWLVNKKYAWEW